MYAKENVATSSDAIMSAHAFKLLHFMKAVCHAADL
jgi:hypothetical protein